MGNPGWKCYERRIARLFGVERKGILGKSDFETDFLAAEVKVLKDLPRWLTDIYGQANKNCPLGKHPIAIIKEKNKKDTEAFVIMRLKNFMYCFFKEKK
jgi:hypothetical protein